MRRNGSIIGSLAIALAATVGVVGGGYMLATGNSLCSLVSACDTTTATTTQVADKSGETTCQKSRVHAAAVALQSECQSACESAKAVAASDNAACGSTCDGAKAVAASDANRCPVTGKIINAADTTQCQSACDGAKAVNAANAMDCGATCEGAKAMAAGDNAQCSMNGARAVNAANTMDCGATCEGAKAMAAGDNAQCSMNGARAVNAANAMDCGATCEGAKAMAAGNQSDCCANGAQAVAASSYECKAESMFCEETMARRAALHNALMPKIQNVSEISNGYAIEFPACSKTLVEVAEMVAMSRECCDFLGYEIVAESHGGPVRLILTGDAGAKAELAKTLGAMVTQVSDAGACAGSCDAAKAVNAVAKNTNCNAEVTVINVNNACCEEGVKAVKAGQDMPDCCKENAAHIAAKKGADLR
ncbi:MAG: hypothetical protein H6813_02955 [Phycisphaeraceae bacterium]|nr:hypothetical protein [Phycisphaeraceae bacterium]MCB9848724.1 hypothetical protein [Phycisphaeraceae bacterium]